MVKDSVNNKSSQTVVAKMTAEEEIEYMEPKGGSQQGLKKGPWTATEDAILMEYVKKHGEGNWNSVQKNSGLMRCGKSCRLRWANHLRPNLKKGSFTPEEERLIIHLHSKIGNKWARMASQLPGRTDNEIKNFWNTRMKRRQRAGLPLYSNEFQESTSAFQLHHRRRRRHQQQEQHKHNPNSQASSLTSFLSSSSHHQKIAYSNYNHSLSSIFNPKITSSHSIDPFQNHLASSFYPNETQCKFYGNVNGNDGSLAMALYHRPHSCTSIFNQNLVEQAVLAPPSQPLQSLHYNGLDFDENVSFTSLIMGGHVGPVGIVPGLNFEIPHDRTPQLTTPLSTPSNTDDVGGVCDVDSSNQNTSNDQEIKVPVMESDGNSGLLDALLHQSNHMAQKEKSNNENRLSLAEFDHKGKGVMSDELKKEEEEEDEEATKNVELLRRNGNEVSGENQCDEMSFSQSSIGYGGTTNPSEEHAEKMNSIEDDLLSLLNFPSSTPPPDWYQQTRNTPNASLSNGHDNGELKIEQVSSSDDPTATENAPPELERALGSYYWNNMPNICEEHPHQDLHVLHGN